MVSIRSAAKNAEVTVTATDTMRTDDWLSAIAADTEMGRAVLDFDWSSTPLGPASTWPQGLRTAVSICLTTRFPALIVWGPDLTKIYNDGYRPMLGSEKHPGALGASAPQVWPEVWDDIGPLFESVLQTGQPSWDEDLPLLVERNGFVEESFFTFSYSPLFDEGTVRGVLDLSVETTHHVIQQRRLECLTDLNVALADTTQVTDACVAAVKALGDHPSEVPTVDLFLHVEHEVVLMASNRRGEVSPRDRIDLDAVLAGTTLTIGGDGIPGHPVELVASPLGGTFSDISGALVIAPNPHRAFDPDHQRFVHAVAESISNALDGAYRRSVELGEFRHISDTLQAAMLPSASDLPTIAARYLPAAGALAVGGDWYDVIDLDDHRRALVVGDCVGHGLEAATVMAQLRSAARAMLLEGRRPAEVIEGLDTFAGALDGAMGTTVVCVVYDRAARRMTYARAGHPPPLVSDGVGAPLARRERRTAARCGARSGPYRGVRGRERRRADRHVLRRPHRATTRAPRHRHGPARRLRRPARGTGRPGHRRWPAPGPRTGEHQGRRRPGHQAVLRIIPVPTGIRSDRSPLT